MQRGAFIVLVLSALITFTIAGGDEGCCNEERHEVPTNCTTTCGGTCDSQGKILHCPNQLIANCKPGCTCAPGYTRLDNSTGSPCVLISSCPPDKPTDLNCGPNTVPVTSGCVDYCPPTCAMRKPKICPTICIQKGCNCKEGYIRSEDRNSLCIRPSQCSCTKQKGHGDFRLRSEHGFSSRLRQYLPTYLCETRTSTLSRNHLCSEWICIYQGLYKIRKYQNVLSHVKTKQLILNVGCTKYLLIVPLIVNLRVISKGPQVVQHIDMLSKRCVVCTCIIFVIIKHFMRNHKNGELQVARDMLSLIRIMTSVVQQSEGQTGPIADELNDVLSRLADL